MAVQRRGMACRGMGRSQVQLLPKVVVACLSENGCSLPSSQRQADRGVGRSSQLKLLMLMKGEQRRSRWWEMMSLQSRTSWRLTSRPTSPSTSSSLLSKRLCLSRVKTPRLKRVRTC
jgi:hypothetical protein